MAHLPKNYELKVYGGWLGKVIGVRFGAPLENWTYQQIKDHLGEIEDYLPMNEGTVFQPDDDTSVPMILLRAVQDYGPQVTAVQMGQTLLNYLGDQHGSLWWGGYGVSSEHTAYLNLRQGVPAPLSGSRALNGEAISEQIGGQIFSDIWGLLNPNHPQRAAEFARKAASVTHDGEGINGGMFIAAMVSEAFRQSDPEALVRAGLAVLPADCAYAHLVREVLDFFHQNPHDWRSCCQMIREQFGYERFSGIVPIIPNAGVVVMGLLYGQGDFGRAIQITNMGGWDTDCNVGNTGAVMGCAVGLEGIPRRWREPVNDTFTASSLSGARNILDIPSVAGLIVNLGREIAGEAPAPRKARCHFDYPGATHGFHFWGEQRNILSLYQQQTGREGVLKAVVRLLKKKQELRLYVETYYHRERLNSDYYAAGFSPTIYPGQTLRARLYLPGGSPPHILAGLYVLDSSCNATHQGQSTLLTPGEWHDLEWRIPPLDSACLAQAGVALRNLGPETWKGEFHLDDFDWDGNPEYKLDFSRAQPEYGAISQWTYLRGYWRLERGGYHGSGAEISETYTGDDGWRDLTLRARLVPLLGENHHINLRVQGALRSYAAGLAPGGRLAVYKKENGIYREVCSAPFKWQMGQPVEIEASAHRDRLAVSAGEAILEWVDETDPYLKGQIGLSNFPGCHTRYESLYVR